MKSLSGKQHVMFKCNKSPKHLKECVVETNNLHLKECVIETNNLHLKLNSCMYLIKQVNGVRLMCIAIV